MSKKYLNFFLSTFGKGGAKYFGSSFKSGGNILVSLSKVVQTIWLHLFQSGTNNLAPPFPKWHKQFGSTFLKGGLNKIEYNYSHKI